MAGSRITSYNVCYTKLLRFLKCASGEFALLKCAFKKFDFRKVLVAQFAFGKCAMRKVGEIKLDS